MSDMKIRPSPRIPQALCACVRLPVCLSRNKPTFSAGPALTHVVFELRRPVPRRVGDGLSCPRDGPLQTSRPPGTRAFPRPPLAPPRAPPSDSVPQSPPCALNAPGLGGPLSLLSRAPLARVRPALSPRWFYEKFLSDVRLQRRPPP